MVTAAEGASEFYDYSNEARFETVSEAITRDINLRKAYLGHHRYFMLDNKDLDFERKINKGINIVANIVGLPTDMKFFQKYLVDKQDFKQYKHSKIKFPRETHIEEYSLLETYLPTPPVSGL